MLFLLYIANFIELAKHHGVNVHSNAGDTQLHIRTPVDQIVEQSVKLTACITDIEI